MGQDRLTAEEAAAEPPHEKLPAFVETPHLKGLIARAMSYLGAGLPLHLSGPAGTGKTTLAVYLASLLGRPMVILHGDEELGSSGLVGGERGYSRIRNFDNFIHSVRKSEDRVSALWVDNRVTLACKQGSTLVYDEFTRSRPEANNVLLCVLAENCLDLPGARGGQGLIEVHPDFRAIFTSNPEEYAGTHKAQHALLDRMVTLKINHPDRESEIAITRAQSQVSASEASKIVAVIRDFREHFREGHGPSLRACVMIGKCLRQAKARASVGDPVFANACMDIICSNGLDRKKAAIAIAELIAKHCR